MKILGKRILVEQMKSSDKSDGGIVIPESCQRIGEEGVVAAIGSGIKESREYRKGSRVFLEMYKADFNAEITYKGKPYHLVSESAICGVELGGRFHPVGERILLKPVRELKSDRLIVPLPDYSGDAASYKEDGLARCTVHLLGSGMRMKDGTVRHFDVAIGDTVLVMPFVGRDVDTPEGTFKLVRPNDIQAILSHPSTSKTLGREITET